MKAYKDYEQLAKGLSKKHLNPTFEVNNKKISLEQASVNLKSSLGKHNIPADSASLSALVRHAGRSASLDATATAACSRCLQLNGLAYISVAWRLSPIPWAKLILAETAKMMTRIRF